MNPPTPPWGLPPPSSPLYFPYRNPAGIRPGSPVSGPEALLYYGRIMQSEVLAGALHGVELNDFSKGDYTLVRAAAGVDIPGVPNYIKEIVIRSSKLRPSLLRSLRGKCGCGRTVWLRSDKLSQHMRCMMR